MARFDELEGPIVLGKNPPDTTMDDEDVMRIFTSHAVGARGEGFLSLQLGGLNTASYFVEKHETPYVMVLILRATEKADEFREVMSDYAERVFDEIEEGIMALAIFLKWRTEKSLQSRSTQTNRGLPWSSSSPSGFISSKG